MARRAVAGGTARSGRAATVRVSGTALLLIDVINDLAFDGSDVLVAQAEPMAVRLSALKRRATAAGRPVIYINDNFGQWRRTFARRSRTVRPAPRQAGVCPIGCGRRRATTLS